jgi:hypothetical protein
VAIQGTHVNLRTPLWQQNCHTVHLPFAWITSILLNTYGDIELRKFVAPAVAQVYLATLWLFLPFMPLFASILFGRLKYLRDYKGTLKKLRVHIAALSEGPAQHYFHDVMGRGSDVPQEVHGHCVQCGNCCMDRRCVFLETADEVTYQCGIYHSPFRKLSNCGSFPLNQWDIERYACPSYTASAVIPIRLYTASNLNDAKVAEQLPIT